MVSRSDNEVLFQSRINVMSRMRGDRLPRSARCRQHLEDGTTLGERKDRTRLAANAKVSEERPRLHMLGRVTTIHTTLFVIFVGFTTPIVWSISRSNHLKESNYHCFSHSCGLA
ncbi:hypothetical protein [Sinorhizobium medicae]|uniref:hypothetical protein n=1 Tax=Sinorhizobium medicae TaxID=110321 RepID=UPI001AED7C3C|nr:hypothetical protein [Sinorhizobium medicae]